MVKNYMEDVVDELLPEMLTAHSEVCSCNRCLADMKAYALNHLKPAYFVMHKGFLYGKVDEAKMKAKADVISAIEKAIKLVSKKPGH
ncbi:MAG: late competence development ComFB family protein [Eubacteriaceae bacterium]|jgi:competence protein ComFB